MNEREVRTALSIISDMPRAQQYELAWKAVAEKDLAIRANGKCWLTYRAVEGELTFDEWTKHIETVPTPDLALHPRWFVSLSTGIVYLKTLNQPMQEAMPTIEKIIAFDPDECPGMLLNYMRVAAILANHLFIEGKKKHCMEVVHNSIATWQRVVSSIDLLKNPSWVADNGFDMAPLHCLLRIASRLKMTSNSIDAVEWMDHLIKGQKRLPWWRCIEKLSREKTIW